MKTSTIENSCNHESQLDTSFEPCSDLGRGTRPDFQIMKCDGLHTGGKVVDSGTRGPLTRIDWYKLMGDYDVGKTPLCSV